MLQGHRTHFSLLDLPPSLILVCPSPWPSVLQVTLEQSLCQTWPSPRGSQPAVEPVSQELSMTP